MNFLTIVFSCIFLLTMTYSYPLSASFSSSSKLNSLPTSQIDQLCSYISQLREDPPSDSPEKRFAIPFPDMSRFLSTSHKIHHHHHHDEQPEPNSETELGGKKHDFEGYLCSISKDSEEMTNFISIFIEEHGEPPAFNLFESCERVAKRSEQFGSENEGSAIIRVNELSEFCSNRTPLRFGKRWSQSVGGPMSIDFINQMLESRKVKSYPYSAEMDPYLVGR